MISFPGTTEESWIKMPGHRIKDLIPRLVEHKKNNNVQCPLLTKKK